MASALNLDVVAQNLIEVALVSSRPQIEFSEDWTQVGTKADYDVFLQIATIILMRRPPLWISSCFVRGAFHPEFIPTGDFDALHWMGDDLEPVLREVHYQNRKDKDDLMKKELGLLGELFVVELLSKTGHAVRHVSQISDSYGYDIESEKSGKKKYWEVKSCTDFTKDRFFVSRNEVRKAKALGPSWCVLQVVFRNGISPLAKASGSDVVELRELPSNELVSICPSESEQFDWIESAVVRPALSSWVAPSVSPKF